MTIARLILLSTVSAIVLSGCKAGHDYVQPTIVKPAEYKESKNWKVASPKDVAIHSKWWEVFEDPELNKLEEQLLQSNQTIKAAEAQFRQARALISEAKAAYLPAINANASKTRDQSSVSKVSDSYSAALDTSWELDVWGRVRRSVEANKTAAQASSADLAAITLSAQAELAVNYISLRMADEQKRLLDNTVIAYERTLGITQNLYRAGVKSQEDMLQARTQLNSAQAQAIDIGIARAQYEHAIAVLIGVSASSFSLPVANNVPPLPAVPASIPADLLERRPDIAAAERRVASANASIGVAEAAFFPTISLSATGGYQSSGFADWFTLPNRIWSIGPSVAESIFDAGLRHAQTKAAIAAYDETVANYKQTVLTSFRDVEDTLSALRLLEEESAVQKQAVKDASESLTIVTNQYKQGIVSFLNVATAQTVELNNKLTALNIDKGRLNNMILLIKALGGGWKSNELDKPEVTSGSSYIFSILPPKQP